jgi:methyltransferase family protein
VLRLKTRMSEESFRHRGCRKRNRLPSSVRIQYSAKLKQVWLRYLRFRLFKRLISPFSQWARRRRLQTMLTVVGIHEGMTVLDVGGHPATWSNPSIPKLNITILNLPGGVERVTDSRHDITYVEGDGCDIANVIDQSFDFVFSNSVIEHVGGRDRQAALVHEIRRIGKAYWVQTPSLWFPVEAHTGMPWWWCYPRFVQR